MKLFLLIFRICLNFFVDGKSLWLYPHRKTLDLLHDIIFLNFLIVYMFGSQIGFSIKKILDWLIFFSRTSRCVSGGEDIIMQSYLTLLDSLIIKFMFL